MEAYTKLFYGKYTTGAYDKTGRQRTDNDAAALARKLGVTMEEAASMPAEKKADAAALLQDTKWLDGVGRGSITVEKNMELAEEYRKKLPFAKIQMVNNAMLEGMSEVGDPEAQAYLNLMTETALEYGRIMAGPTSNAMIPMGVAQQQTKRMGAGLSDAQFAEERKLMKRSMDNQLDSSREVIEKRKNSLRSVGSAQPDPGSVKYEIGGVVPHGDKRYRIKTLKPDGTPDDVEEVK
jgi:hypothetical protein